MEIQIQHLNYNHDIQFKIDLIVWKYSYHEIGLSRLMSLK